MKTLKKLLPVASVMPASFFPIIFSVEKFYRTMDCAFNEISFFIDKAKNMDNQAIVKLALMNTPTPTSFIQIIVKREPIWIAELLVSDLHETLPSTDPAIYKSDIIRERVIRITKLIEIIGAKKYLDILSSMVDTYPEETQYGLMFVSAEDIFEHGKLVQMIRPAKRDDVDGINSHIQLAIKYNLDDEFEWTLKFIHPKKYVELPLETRKYVTMYRETTKK